MQLQYAGGNGPLGFGYKMIPRSISVSDSGGFMDDMEEDEEDDMLGGGGYSRKRGFVQNAAASAARKRRHDMNHRVKRLLDLVPVSNK
ncbi:hypothetical protein CLOM_g5318, partial [Closterium sp. NIES-68]